MRDLTEKQQAILNYIKDYKTHYNYFPSRKEMAETFEISTKAIQDHLKAIEKKGKIRISQNTARTIEVLDEEFIPKSNSRKIPILGTIAAGTPIFTEEVFEDFIEISEDRLSANFEYFGLNVRGESMIDAGILEDDIAIIQKCKTANNGEIIAALVNEEAITLKRYYLEQNRIKLKAENKSIPPMYTRNVEILGKLKLIIREY
ncbi:MAG: repressor LexA [Spirochaetales bacterium]|nr:repressor LexA [Spirochaetales bacterium]